MNGDDDAPTTDEDRLSTDPDDIDDALAGDLIGLTEEELRLLDAENHEQALKASEDPRPNTAEEDEADADLLARARRTMSMTREKVARIRQTREEDPSRSARQPPNPQAMSARRRFFERCFNRDDPRLDELNPVLGIRVKDWNVFRAFCRELGINADLLRQLYAEDPRRCMMAPDMAALMVELYQRGFCSLDQFDTYCHERAMIASEDPRPPTPDDKKRAMESYEYCLKIMAMSPEELRALRARRRGRKPSGD